MQDWVGSFWRVEAQQGEGGEMLREALQLFEEFEEIHRCCSLYTLAQAVFTSQRQPDISLFHCKQETEH